MFLFEEFVVLGFMVLVWETWTLILPPLTETRHSLELALI